MIHTRDHRPPHVTVYNGRPADYQAIARIEIETGRVMSSDGFNKRSIKVLKKIIKVKRIEFLEKWNETRPKE